MSIFELPDVPSPSNPATFNSNALAFLTALRAMVDSINAGDGLSPLGYVAGSWTPVIADAASGGNVATPAVAVGHYIKFGAIRFIQFELTNINRTGMTTTNGIFLRGIPDACKAVNSSAGIVGHVRTSNFTFTNPPYWSGGNGYNYFELYQSISGAGAQQLLVSALAGDSSSDLFGSFAYMAD